MTTKATQHPKEIGKISPVARIKEAVPEMEETSFGVFLKHQRKALVEAGKALESFLPEPVREHSEAAYKEAVEGYKTLVNSTIDDIVDRFEKVKIKKDHEPKPEQVGGQAVLGRQDASPTPWLTERHGYDPT